MAKSLNAAVTICALNYLAKALVLYHSYRQYHPDDEFYLVIVDRKIVIPVSGLPGLNIVWAEDLPIDNFLRHAFAFDVIELNTNVKPFVLNMLLGHHGSVVYLDPDIQIFAALSPVFEALKNSAIVVTPHANTPILDGCKPDDVDFLKFGAFNLGFIGVSRCAESVSFLAWWSARCLEYGFYEPQLGLAVDQKWVNLAVCYFPSLRVLRDIGLNVAFWNLHERRLSREGGNWVVNDKVRLRFVHFSSFDASIPDQIAQKQNRFVRGSRPDFSEIARVYAQMLDKAGLAMYSKHRYGFDYFDDGTYITPALRRYYAVFRNSAFSEVENPFDSVGPVGRFARKHGLLSSKNAVAKRGTFLDMSAYSFPIKVIHKLLRLSLFILGPNRYYNLMRYLSHISSLRNQGAIFGKLD